jgi:putative MATE family efflux protein
MNSDKNLIKPLLALAGPIILANFFQAAYQLTDAFWVGRLGEKAVASVAVCMPIIFFMMSFGIGFSIAGATLTAQYFGAKDKKMVSHSSAQTLLLVIVVSAITSTLGFWLSTNILKFLGVEAGIFDSALAYLRISFLGIVFNFVFFMFQSIMRSIGKAKLPVYIVIGTVILNFILDPLLMFGIGPIPALGVAGTAWATLFTQSIASIIGMFILFSGSHGIKLHWPDFIPDYKFLKKAFWLGLPSSLETSARSLVLTIMTGLITSFGTLAIAAYGVGSNIFQLILMLCFGFAGANSALVGQSLGAGDKKRAERVAKLSLKLIFISLSIVGVIIFVFAKSCIAFFVPNDINVINEGARFLRFIALTSGLTGIQVIIGSTLQAAGSTKQSMILTIVSQWVVQLPLAYLLAKVLDFGLDGIWVTLPITSVIMSIIYMAVFLRGKWKEKKLIDPDAKMRTQINEEVKIDEIVSMES